MNDYNQMWGALRNAVNQTARSMPWLGVPAIMGKPIAEAGLAGLGWGAGATKAAASGYKVDPGPSLYNMVNIYGLGGPAGGLTSGGMKAAPWFSAVGRAIESSPLKSAPGSQWAGTIKNTPGVKQEELEWTGLLSKLNEEKGLLTKEALKDYWGKNRVDVQEVVKGGEAVHSYPEVVDDEIGGGTKFSQWQMPGGENYRELLLTLPKRPPDDVIRSQGYYPHEYDSLPENVKILIQNNMENPAFKGGHYDEPNVLAHVRFNDRVDASGKKTLFLEEIQSDWHQKGRKEGYQGEALKASVQERDGLYYVHSTTGEQLSEGYASRDAAQRYANQLDANSTRRSNAVPDAPFKSSWPELSLKRMIKWAADNGYDQIAWTPGKVQAERYDLSKQVESIKLHHDTPAAARGGGILEIRPKGDDSRNGIRLQFDKSGKVEATFGGTTGGAGQFEGKTLDEIVGKDMADKIMKDAEANSGSEVWGVKNRESGNWSPRFKSKAEAEAYQQNLPEATRKQTDVLSMSKKASTTYTGVDLQVGGEGMKAFYDKMLVNAANKLGKKYGAKVGVTKIDARPKASAAQRADFEAHATPAEMAKYGSLSEVWSLPITDAMKKEVTEKGMPLFSGGRGGSLASILQQALTGDKGDETLGGLLGKALGDKSR